MAAKLFRYFVFSFCVPLISRPFRAVDGFDNKHKQNKGKGKNSFCILFYFSVTRSSFNVHANKLDNNWNDLLILGNISSSLCFSFIKHSKDLIISDVDKWVDNPKIKKNVVVLPFQTVSVNRIGIGIVVQTFAIRNSFLNWFFYWIWQANFYFAGEKI